MRKPHWKKHRKIVNGIAILCGIGIIGGLTCFMVFDSMIAMMCFLVSLPVFLLVAWLNKLGWI